MASILEINPEEAGLDAAASVVGRLAAPSRMPMGLGSILGQAGGAYSDARSKAAFQQEQLAQTRMQREAQAEALREQARARQEALLEKQQAAQRQQKFNSILGNLQKSGQPMDEISILGAGIESGAFGPKETTEFMSKVMEKKAKREQDLLIETRRLEDKAISREEKEAAERRMVQLRGDIQKENMRLAAALRRQPQGQVIENDKGEVFRLGPDGVPKPVLNADGTPFKKAPKGAGNEKLTELEAKGTVFMRQMESAEDAAKKIVGDSFDLGKLGNQAQVRMAGSDLTNWAATPNAQKYNQAAEQWAEAFLRIKTGAAATADEVKKNARTFFPQPGDKPEVIAQKAAMRKKAIEDVSIFAGRGANREPPNRGAGKDPWED